ncbi:type II/IV secretion system ATPase subunit [Candidatus Woesearchaeota archaeon]|nr:type II/IV secretion system ATPase subunit [Candidatus Woesearchaeota archaeon]
MALFDNKDKKAGKGSYEVIREGKDNILKINCENCQFIPSIEDNSACMSETIDKLISNKDVTKIVFTQKRDYEYDFEETLLLKEIALVYNKLVKEKSMFSYSHIVDEYSASAKNYAHLKEIIFNVLKQDPVGAYIMIKRLRRKKEIEYDKEIDKRKKESLDKYLSVVNKIIRLLENTKLIEKVKGKIAGYKIGDRKIYRDIFSPIIKPDFMFTKLMATYPKRGEEIDNYNIGNTEVVVFRVPDKVQYIYHITPPEFKLEEEKYELLTMARDIMAEHKPQKEDFVEPERMRSVFYNVGKDLLNELASYHNIELTDEDIEEMTQILIRYTVGFGLIEILLADPEIQDITLNAPLGNNPIYIVHGKHGECETNIIPTIKDALSWATKLRMISGRPLDEANPILDTEIEIPNTAKARVGVISEPLNPFGIAYAFRRHRAKPWTLPLFIENKMLTPLAAGLLSFLIDGSRTMLIAGTRSAGKTSLLGSLMIEIMRKYRIITVEDTLELPTASLRNLDYNIQPMKVASALGTQESEVSATQGIRSTLRMGDSCLIIGEVRSKEARALYEAMRVGALANVVAGTIHGDSPYGVFDRVVNDLEVPRTSFKATDIIVVANPIKSPDGLHKWRRITQITEVTKEWEQDPLKEKGFIDLMKYNSATDSLEPTSALLDGESTILKDIAANVKEWAGDWDAVWDNIQLRAKIKERIVKFAEKTGKKDVMEAPFVVQANDNFHRISERIREKEGKLNSKKIFFEWDEWFKKAVKEKNG